jgi:hypothetical protein
MNRAWCGQCQYPDKEPFVLGTVVLPKEQTEREAREALLTLWANLSPHPAPDLIAVPGICFFYPESQS